MHEKMIKKLTANVDFRVTKQRKKILDVLISQDQHLLAQNIYEILREEDSKVGLATVYRTLDLFEESGIIKKRKFNGDSAYYEINDEHHGNHHHLICKSCGAVIEVDELLPEDIEERLEEEEGFQVEDLCLQMYGYCENCQKNSDE